MSMKTLLDAIIDESPNGIAENIQISFKPGVTTTAGALKHHDDIEGIFCLGTATRANQDTPGHSAGEVVIVEQIFDADAVQSIVRIMPKSSIITPV